MSTITKQWLQQKIADMEAARDEIPFGLDEDGSNTLAYLRIALASLESEAGEYLTHVVDDGYGEFSDRMNFSLPVGTKLYAAPPAPVSVPDEATPENIQILASTYAPRGVTYQWDRDECNAAADSWNACRAAMLQGAEPVTTANKLPTESAREKALAIQLLSVIKDLGLPENCPFVDVLNEIYRLQSNSPVIPDELIRRIAFNLVYLSSDEKVRSNEDSLFSLVRQGIDQVRKELAAPQQEVK